MNAHCSKKISIITLSVTLIIGVSAIAQAQSTIVVDGTTGVIPAGTQIPTDANKVIAINGDGANRVGTVNGTNLFFSFDKLGVASGDTAHLQCATSTCGGSAVITNVISRVTGTGVTNIDGTLKSTVGTANVWLFNPNGVAIGADAKIDVPAAVHIGAASQLNDASGNMILNADGTKNASTFTAATPTSFGFTGSTGNIVITGSTINVGKGASEIAAAHDVIINNSQIAPISGTLDISAQHKITIDATPLPLPAVASHVTADLTAGTDISNSGIITGNATTKGILTNSGTITGNAAAGTDLINKAGGTIGTQGLNNTATATVSLDNSGTIHGDAVTTGKLTNSSVIDGNANAGTDLINKAGGTIGILGLTTANTVVAGKALNNSGIINGNITAGSSLNNTGTITGDAAATTGALTNSKLITGNTAGDTINNNGTIQGNAQAIAALNNSGVISNNATAGTKIDNNGGTIDGNTTVINGQLLNRAASTIKGKAAATDINNNGIIQGNADATGTLDNSGIIGTAGANNKATAGNSLNNTGTIIGDATVTTGALTNSKLITGNTAGDTINNNGTIQGNADATGTLDNSGIIGTAGANNKAIAGSSLNNTGTITGDATASTGVLTNSQLIAGNAAGDTINNNGTIQGSVQAIAALNNTGIISNNATAGTKIDNNSGTIDGNTTVTNGQLLNHATSTIKGNAAATDITNNGIIQGNAQATGTLDNSGIIGTAGANNKTTAGSSLNNTGTITGDAATTGALKNSQLIAGNAAGDTINNNGIIQGNAQATGILDNSGIIGTAGANNKATAGSSLNNTGTITGDAIATTGALTNSQLITGNAAGDTLNNNGTIQGNANAAGILTNNNSISGVATAGVDIINNIGGIINKGAIAGNNVINYGTINGEKIHAGQDIINEGTAAAMNLNAGEVSANRDVVVNDGSSIIFSGMGKAAVIAGRVLTVSNNAVINALNTGKFYALAGGDLIVNSAAKLIANNTDNNIATIGAGTAVDSTGQLSATSTGGNLLVQQGGIIEKTNGAGNLTLLAHAGSATDNGNSGGQLVVDGAGSTVRVSHAGDLIISPDALVSEKYLNNNHQFIDSNNKAQYALRVSNSGVINKNNSGTMDVTAQTVYLSGKAIIGTTAGEIAFNAVTPAEQDNTARLPRYFKMQDSIMRNVGAISLSDYFLNLDSSGIKSDTSITLNIFNAIDIAHPKVLIGSGSSAIGLATGKSFLDAPSSSHILINSKVSLNPEDNITTLTRNIVAAMVGNSAMPTLPKNPCDSYNQSTLSTKGVVANYIPDISSQVPYSLLAMSTTPSASLEQNPALTLNESVDCQ